MYRTFTACFTPLLISTFFPRFGGGGGGGRELLPIIYREALLERGTFFTLQVYETVGLSRVEACMKE